MAFHTKDDLGKELKKKEAMDLISETIELGFWGFVPKNTLELLLKGLDCVGIRVYSAFQFESKDTLIVIGVTEDGDEIQQTVNGEPGYTVCSMQNDLNAEANISNVGTRQVERAIAKKLFEDTVQSNPQLDFASYFSAQVILDLLKNKKGNGINFYKIESGGDFDFSHLAIPALHAAASNRIELVGKKGQFVLCPNPCPNHCAPGIPVENSPAKQASGIPAEFNINAQAAPLALAESAFTKYLPDWM